MISRQPILWILFLASYLQSYAIGFLPVVRNYTSNDYEAGNQNWSVTQNAEGMMFFGNNFGLLSYDGYSWKLHELPRKILVRSLLADGDRIYAGAYKEFGYFRRDSYGNYQFTSLWDKLKGYKPHNDEIWNIVKTKDGRILFQSFCSWFEYDGKNVRAHYDGKNLPLYFFSIHNNIYAQLIGGDFCLLAGNRYKPAVRRQELGDDDVVAALDIGRDKTVLCTESHGLFLFDGTKTTPFRTQADDILKKVQLNRATYVRKTGTIVLGTIQNGIISIDKSGRLQGNYGDNKMLKDNTVLSLFCDRDNCVWAALDTGIALLQVGSPFTVFSGDFGKVYDVYQASDGLYIASNQQTMLFSEAGLRSVEGTNGQNWYITSFGSQLVVGHNHGMRLISGTESTQMAKSDNTSSTAVKHYYISETRHYLLEATYSVLRLYQKVDGKWEFRNIIRNFMAPVQQLEIDGQGMVWATNMHGGGFKIELNESLDSAISVKEFHTLDGSSMLNLFSVWGKVYFSNGKHFFSPDGNGTLRKCPPRFDELARYKVLSATMVNKNLWWLATAKGYLLVEWKNQDFVKKAFVPAGLFGLECGDFNNQVSVFGNDVYFCMNNGIGHVNMKDMEIAQGKSTLSVRNAFYREKTTNRPQAIRTDGVEMPQIKGGDLTVEMSYPNFTNRSYTFVFTLKGSGEERVYRSVTPKVQFTRISDGCHTLECRVTDMNNNVLATKTFRFESPAPWYRTLPMLFLYVMFVGLVLYFFIKWRLRKAVRKQMRIAEHEQMRQKLEIAHQQHIIDAQQKQILEQKLQDKGKEIAAIAMDAISPNSANKDDAYWNMFRENFDLIHKHYFRNLMEKYPTLTPSDLKFCAYLRLNLCTKDISQITGLSIRGVESARYRLRKKFNLSMDESLTTFLLNIK